MAKAPTSQQVVVNTKEHFDLSLQQYLSAGYSPRQMTADLAILVKPGASSNLGCAFWFFLFVFFPIAIIMAISNGKQAGEQTVTIHLVVQQQPVLPGPQSFAPDLPTELQMSEDRQQWWDGRQWIQADDVTPPMAKKSDNGQLWWDGGEWRATR
jgi:hypothetical protein